MSSYSTTATITGVAQVRARPAGGLDTYAPDTIDVARNGLETQARDVVRLDVTQGNGVEASIYLAREAAEELAEAILRAADLIAGDPQPEPRLAGGVGYDLARAHSAPDRQLRVVERAVSEAVAMGCLRTEVLGRVANALTGAVSGPRERLLTRALDDAVESYADLTQDEAKVIEDGTR